MAADYIVISRANRPQLGSQLIAAANRLKELRELIDGLSDAANRMVNGGDHAKFIAQFGVTIDADVTAANVVSLIGLIHNIFNTNTDVSGLNRLSQLDEFAARIAGQ